MEAIYSSETSVDYTSHLCDNVLSLYPAARNSMEREGGEEKIRGVVRDNSVGVVI
jgi:hypothetical protein